MSEHTAMQDELRDLTAQLHAYAAAPVVLVLHADGRADLTVADSVDDEQLAAYVEGVAGMIRRGEHRTACESCASGAEHDHGVPSGHDDPPAASPAPS